MTRGSGRARGGRPGADLRGTAWRIGLQTAGLLVACLVVVGAVLYLSVVRSQDQQLARTLSAATGTVGHGRDDGDSDNGGGGGRPAGNRPGLDQPRGGVQWAVIDKRQPRDSGDLPPGLPLRDVMQQVRTTGVRDQRTVHLATGAYEVLTVQRGEDTVQVAANLFEQHQERERILAALGLAGGAGLVLATLAAAVLARRAVAPMAEALEQQRRFVADAGHELRTPLTLLSTRAQLLARRVRGTGAPPERQAGLVERDAAALVGDATALVAILEDLLIAADPHSAPSHERVDLRDVAASAVSAARPAAEQAGVALALEAATGPTAVLGAPAALRRAVAALVDNAVEHARSRVDVRLTSTPRQVVVEVLDDGPGIARETLPRMFDRFASDRRAPSPGARRHFGLGLALVSEVADRHAGSVSAANRPEQDGAVLRLVLPSTTAVGEVR